MMRTRTLLLNGLLLAMVLAVAACGSGAEDEEFGTPISNQVEAHEEPMEGEGGHTHLDPEEVTGKISVALVPSEMVVGPNRFAVGLFDEQGNLIPDAEIHFHYYDLRDPERAVYESDADAERIQSPDGQTTIYTHDREFDMAGLWGVEIEAKLANGEAAKQRIGVEILQDSTTLSPGDKAPYIHTPVLNDVGLDASQLTSAQEPLPALHETSLDAAIDNEQPTLLLFATPAFCETRFCGPAYEMVGELHQDYADQLNFVYVEVFAGLPDPAVTGWQATAGAQAFGIQSEPWVYFIDEDGTIVYRLEGLFTAEELEQQLHKRLGL
jgi:hypothetical protein